VTVTSTKVDALLRRIFRRDRRTKQIARVLAELEFAVQARQPTHRRATATVRLERH
jgi:hypothetical protein